TDLPIALLILVVLLSIFTLPRFARYLERKKRENKLASVRAEIRTLMAQFGQRRDEWIIIDTETTGLTKNDVVIEIGIISGYGQVLMDSRVKLPPRKRIGKKAQEIHGISRQALEDAPDWLSVRSKVDEIAKGKE